MDKQDMFLNKLEFQDAFRPRYNLKIENLPSACVCGTNLDVFHALSCAKGGFISQRHDDIKNIFVLLFGSVSMHVLVESDVIPVSEETFRLKSENIEKDARLDIKANSFYSRIETAFLMLGCFT